MRNNIILYGKGQTIGIELIDAIWGRNQKRAANLRGLLHANFLFAPAGIGRKAPMPAATFNLTND